MATLSKRFMVSFVFLNGFVVGELQSQCSNYWYGGGVRPGHQNCSENNGPSPWLYDFIHKQPSQRRRMTAKYFPDFIHIAKNGGGTITHIHFDGHEHALGEPFSGGISRFQRDGKGCFDGETPPRGSKLWHREPTFCVVRHPLTHVVSSMNFAANGRDKAWVGRSLHHMAILLHEEQIRENNEGFLPETFDRNKFNQSELSLSEKKMFIGQQWCHFIPQTDYIWNEEGERTCNYVLRYEHFHEDFKLLCDLYGQTSGTDSSTNILDLKENQVHVDKNDQKYTYLDMDEDLREAYLKLYAIDLCLLGYDQDPAKPVASLLRSYIEEHGGEAEVRQCFHERDSRVKLISS